MREVLQTVRASRVKDKNRHPAPVSAESRAAGRKRTQGTASKEAAFALFGICASAGKEKTHIPAYPQKKANHRSKKGEHEKGDIDMFHIEPAGLGTAGTLDAGLLNKGRFDGLIRTAGDAAPVKRASCSSERAKRYGKVNKGFEKLAREGRKKARALIADARKKNVGIKEVPPAELRALTISSKNGHFAKVKETQDKKAYTAAERADEATLARWEVNYIRHKLTDYDVLCARLNDIPGGRKLAGTLKRLTLDVTAKTYPHLSEECDRQIGLLLFDGGISEEA
jgi:hypothetical protein